MSIKIKRVNYAQISNNVYLTPSQVSSKHLEIRRADLNII